MIKKLLPITKGEQVINISLLDVINKVNEIIDFLNPGEIKPINVPNIPIEIAGAIGLLQEWKDSMYKGELNGRKKV